MKPQLGNNQWKKHGTACNMSETFFYDQDSESGRTYSGQKYVVIVSLISLFST